MATSAERVSWILQVNRVLDARSWSDENMILGQFAIPKGPDSGARDHIRNTRLGQADDQTLHALYDCLPGSASKLEPANQADLARIWGLGSPRVFLSHKAEYGALASALKDRMGAYQTAVFVAHEDIEPTRTWQAEIERALRSMDALVALLTRHFALSPWTNQEIGVALGRGVPVLTIRIDEDPSGFLGATQSIAGANRTLEELAALLFGAMSNHASLAEPMLLGLVRQWESVQTYDDGGKVMSLLSACRTMPVHLLDRIELAYSENDQLHDARSVNRMYSDFIRRMRARSD